MLMLCGSRASFRLIAEFVRRRRDGLRLVIYGAGHGGALVIREMLSQPDYSMLGFIDDDPRRQNLRLHGYLVLGAEAKLLELVKQHEVDVVVISSREFDPARLHKLASACQAEGIRLLRFQFNLQELVSCA